MDFILSEVKEFNHDLECIRWLINECNSRKMDSNLFYELNYYSIKLHKWKENGILDSLILLEVNDLLSLIDNVIESTSESEAYQYLCQKEQAMDLLGFDKIKYYDGKEGFNGCLKFRRQKYTDILKQKMDKHNERLIKLFLFLPIFLISLFITILSISVCIKQLTPEVINIIAQIILYFACGIWSIYTIIVVMKYCVLILPWKMDSCISLYTGKYYLQKESDYYYYYYDDANIIINDRVQRNYYMMIYTKGLSDIYRDFIVGNKHYLSKEQYSLYAEAEYYYNELCTGKIIFDNKNTSIIINEINDPDWYNVDWNLKIGKI